MFTTARFTKLLLVLLFSQPFALGVERSDYFVFLVTGKSTAGTEKEAIQKMQAEHIANFERLAKLGELSAAGPCADPEKYIRGIVVLHADSIKAAESKFEPDPYISNGFMKPEMHQYRTIVGKFVVPEDTQKMDQYVIAILSKGEAWPATRLPSATDC